VSSPSPTADATSPNPPDPPSRGRPGKREPRDLHPPAAVTRQAPGPR
jgi:hypothetical protein